MGTDKIIAGFAGAGGIAKAHVFSLNSIRYYYDDAPDIERESVCSLTETGRTSFAAHYGFNCSQDPESFFRNGKLNTIFILGPNKIHYEFLSAAINMPSVSRIYLEKPVCSTAEEEKKIRDLVRIHPEKKIQVGFQYLFSTQIMGALSLWRSNVIGKPVHFEIKYFHGDYLRKEYRDKRTSRLTPAPDGGAMADLGSHAISLLVAFLGNGIEVLDTIQAGHFPDVPEDTDLFSLMTLRDKLTGAAGTISSSRISSGSGDLISFELYAEKGSVKFSTYKPDSFEFYTEEEGVWKNQVTGSNYRPFSTFPSGHVPPGWLRSMIHAHYVFLTGNGSKEIIPDINHGLEVQRILRTGADRMKEYRRLHLK